MKAEIISVGTELLLGHTINSDAAYVARTLASLGIDTLHMQVVGDNAQRLEQALSASLERSDIVVTTGGLGPTNDDLTKETAAKISGRPLKMDSQSLERLKEYFGSRPMTENQLKQAMMPDGATIFANKEGTAPGCAIPCGDDKFIILLPGPPRELRPMLQSGVVPFLEKFAAGVIHSVLVRTFGIGEGAAAQVLGNLLEGDNPTAATYAADGEMFVKITAKAATGMEAEKLAQPLVDAVRKRLGDVVYGFDVPSLEYVVTNKLIAMRKTVATAESCTGGLLAKRITDIPGASAIFNLGLVSYSNDVKAEILGVPQKLIAEYGAVSPQVAQSMAENIRRLNSSDFGVGITGIAGPDGGTPQKPLGLVYIALAFEGGLWQSTMQPQGRYLGRDWVRNRAASTALDLVRRHLYGLPESI